MKICLDLQNIIYVRWGCNMLEHKIVEESDGNDSEDSDEDFFDCRETLSLRSRTASIPSVESDGGKVWLTYPFGLVILADQIFPVEYW